MTDRNATLTFSDGSPPVTFPVLSGTIGPDVIVHKWVMSARGACR